MKRIISLILAAVIFAFVLVSCGNNGNTATDTKEQTVFTVKDSGEGDVIVFPTMD